MTYAAAYRGRDRVARDGLLRGEGHPLGLRKVYEDPADIVEANGINLKRTFGVAAGALLVAGTFAAGALGLNGGSLPVAGENAPEYAPAAPGHGPNGPAGPDDIGTPAVAAPPHGDDHGRTPPDGRSTGGTDAARRVSGTGGANGATNGGAQGGGTAATPAPAPAPDPTPAPGAQQNAQQASSSGAVEQVVTPVTDTVGDVAQPITDSVGNLLSPVTGTLTGGGDQPALTMIDPLGGLLGG